MEYFSHQIINFWANAHFFLGTDKTMLFLLGRKKFTTLIPYVKGYAYLTFRQMYDVSLPMFHIFTIYSQGAEGPDNCIFTFLFCIFVRFLISSLERIAEACLACRLVCQQAVPKRLALKIKISSYTFCMEGNSGMIQNNQL